MTFRYLLPSLLAAFALASAEDAPAPAAKPAAAVSAPSGSASEAAPAAAAASSGSTPATQAAPAASAAPGETVAQPTPPGAPAPKARKKPKASPAAAEAAPGAAAGAAAAPAAAKAGKGPGAVVITVGPNKIRRGQIDHLVEQMKKASPSPRALDEREESAMAAMIATNLIGQELLDLESKRLALEASQAEVDSMYKLMRGNFPDEATWKLALKDGGNTEAGFKEKLAKQIKADKILNKQVPQVERPTYKEIIDYHASHKAVLPVNDSLRAAQIVLIAGNGAKPEAAAAKKAELEKIRAELAKDSADPDKLLLRFMMAARKISDGPEKVDGGDLRRFHPNDFSPDLKKQVTALRVGQMSPVFKSPLGWHLILLTEKHDGKPDSYRYLIARVLAAEKSAEAGKTLRKYLQGLAAKYKVSYLESAYRDTSPTGVYNL